MTGPANPRPEAAGDVEMLRRYAEDLADAITRALAPWVERSVATRAEQWRSGTASERVRADAAEAGRRATAEVGPRIRALLQADVDGQRTGPLALLRDAVRYPTEVLASAGVAPVRRDPFAERAFPDDVYDLAPASFADVDPELHEPGLIWGAAKAHVVLARRRAEGRT